MFVSADGMKMRGMKNETNGSAKANKVVREGGASGGAGRGRCFGLRMSLLVFQDEDLKWVEENIPSSMADV